MSVTRQLLKIMFRRLAILVPVLWVTVTITFFLLRLAPGNPFLEERAYSAQALAQLDQHYGLDQPLAVQYVRWLGKAVRGDLGPSLHYHNRTVSEIIAQCFPVSLELGAWALLVAILLGIIPGVVASLRPNSAMDHGPMSVAMLGICIPGFVLGPLLIMGFSIKLRWFNAVGWNTPGDRVLPAITLGTAYAAYIARLARAGMLDVLPRDFIRTARAKGLSAWRVVFVHALKPGLLPVVSFMGPAIAGLITGSFVTESIFHLPGLGSMFVMGAFNRDYTLVLGLVAFYSVLVVLFNLAVDLVLLVMDPRLRTGERAS
jgi:oligopeptide transport system permease protein